MSDGHDREVTLIVSRLALALCGLIPAGILGPARDRIRRARVAFVSSIILSVVALLWPCREPYGFVIHIPCLSFFIAACVGGITGHRARLYGTLASVWYGILILVGVALVNPTIPRRTFSVDIPLLVLLPGLIGAASASGVLWLSTHLKQGEKDR